MSTATTSPKCPSKAKTNIFSSTNYSSKTFSNLQSLKLSKTMINIHAKTKKNGLKSLHILTNNIGNCRYPGFSQFQSENSFQNSSYCWSFSKKTRFTNKRLLNQSIYNLPSMRTTRFTTFGVGPRKTMLSFHSAGNSPSPDTYHVESQFEFNKRKKKGASLGFKRNNDSLLSNAKTPGVGSYNINLNNMTMKIPIKIKSRICFFYDDDLKKRKHCVSMQKYSPKMSLVQGTRFHNITFGIGPRSPNENMSVKNYPGPGTYHVPSIFDRGYKNKLPLN